MERATPPRVGATPADADPRVGGDAGELRGALLRWRGSFAAIGGFSFCINLLTLGVPLYVLQVYDRVLGSRSESTLVALTVLIVAMLGLMALLDWVRSRVMVRIGANLDAGLNERVFKALFAEKLSRRRSAQGEALRDLESLRQFMTGAGPFALFDAPWVPIYVLVLFLFHPTLGWIGAGGALLLFAVALMNEIATRRPIEEASRQWAVAGSVAAGSLRNAEVLEALGMEPAMRRRWLVEHRRVLGLQALASDRAGSFTAASKALRLLLQVAVVGAGAALAIRQEITPGTLIASAIMLGRALAPVEQAIAHWRGFLGARVAYGRLAALLREHPAGGERMRLPTPRGALRVENVSAVPPEAEAPVLRGVSFALERGESLGVVGPTASGKSSLARVLVGVWPPASGSVRVDGADLRDWSREQLGPHLGYLPQDVELFAGSVAENIARFAARPDAEKIVRAAKRAGVHDMVLRLPQGYDTWIGPDGQALSGGQRQRIGLARALYGDPVLVVLDEPNANLDAEGDQALARALSALRRQGSTVVVMAHRPAAVASVDKLLVLKEGRVLAFGPRREILGAGGRIELGNAPATRGPKVAPLRGGAP